MFLLPTGMRHMLLLLTRASTSQLSIRSGTQLALCSCHNLDAGTNVSAHANSGTLQPRLPGPDE